MKREDARAMARELMDRHGLREWSLRFDRARRRAGACVHTRREIRLSGPLVDLYDSETVRGVILHEIAHALVGASHHHDAIWQAKARQLGAPDSARLSAHLPSPRPSWVGVCPVCGTRRELYSAPRRVTSCGVCSRTFDASRIFIWSYKGQPRQPGGQYAHQLRSLRRHGHPKG